MNPALGGYGRTDINKKFNRKKARRKYRNSFEGMGANGPKVGTGGKPNQFYGSGPNFPRYT